MSTELAFARKASGLVRGLSTGDVFGMALMFIQPILGIYVSVALGAAIFPGGNLLICLGISLVTCGVFGPLMWGILSGTMPRSGGEYVFNSRILNAPVAQAASIAATIASIYFGFVVSTWIASSLQMLCEFMGWNGAAIYFGTNRSAAILLGVAALILAFVVVAFGMRTYKRIQKPFVVVGIGGPLVLLVSIAVTSRASFIQSWNELATKYHSLDYQSFVTTVGRAVGGSLPSTWNWHDTLGMTGAISLFFVTYGVVYVGGEVKRPQKSMLVSAWLAIGATVAIAGGTFFALYHTLGFTFLNATAVNTLFGGVQGYTFPFPSNYLAVAWIAAHHNAVIGWIAALTFLLTSFWVLVLMFTFAGRTLFAWGMDRMGPKWFTSVSPRQAVPIWNLAGWLAACVVGLVIYKTWLPSLSTIIGTGVMMVSVFLITGVSALVLPYRKKTRDMWSLSPHRRWKIAGIPVITIAGAVWLVYTGVLLYYVFVDPKARVVTGKNMIYFLLATWTIGVLWYLFWSWRSRAVGVEVSVTYSQLPPE